MKKEKAFQTEGGAWTVHQGEKGQGIAPWDSSFLNEKAEGGGQERWGRSHAALLAKERISNTVL